MNSLNWPDCRNVRDLGGLPISGGGITRTGALIRSDNLDRLTPQGIAAVRAARVSRIVDVRSAWECEHFPSEFTNTVTWRNFPVVAPDGPDLSDRPLAEQFIWSLDHCAELITAAIAAIADAPDGAVLVHCHAGKDRTGVIIALVLDVIGVPRPAVAADYAFLGVDVRTLVGMDGSGKPELEAPQEATILRVLDHIDNTYGGTARYLRQSGLTDPQLTAIKTRLIS